MVPRKSWVLENFSPILESWQRFSRVPEAHFFLVWFKNRLSLGLGFSNKGLCKSLILPFGTPNTVPAADLGKTEPLLLPENMVRHMRLIAIFNFQQ